MKSSTMTSADRRNQAINICRSILDNGADYAIVDTETTGLDGELIEIAVIDGAGKTLLHEFRHPIGEVHPKALETHGLTHEVIESKSPRPWSEWWLLLGDILEGRTFAAYNADFDWKIINNTAKAEGTQSPLECVEGNKLCIMNLWSDFIGVSKWQKLAGGDHTAMGDCIATLERIKVMAVAELSEPLPEKSFDELAAELSGVTEKMKALKKAEADLKAQILAKLLDNNLDGAELSDGRAVSISRNIVKLKALKPEDELNPAFFVKTLNAKTIKSLIESGAISEDDGIFSWEYSMFPTIR